MQPFAHLKTLPRLLAFCGTLLAVCLATLPTTLHAQATGYTDWNAGRDLALNEKPDGGARESANPNATVPQWSYGYRTGIENTSLTLYTAAEHLNVTSGIYAGYEGYGDTAQQYGAGVHVGTEAYTFSGLETLAPDEIFTSVDDHSTDGNNAIRWTCPVNGTYSYRVAWRDLDSRGGDGAAGYVVINGAQRFKGTWPNGSGQGAATTGTVTLNAGDVFDVMLNANSSDSSYDTAGTRIVIVPGSVVPPQSLSLPLATNADGKLDVGTFNGGATMTLAFSGNGDLVDARYQTKPDGSLSAPATGGYEFANAGAAYPTQDGGDGINHFMGGGANYDATGSGYGFAGKLTTDTTDPAAIRNGAVVGTFSASPTRGDWFLIGNGATVTVPAGGGHLYVAVNDTVSGDNHGAYTGTLSATGGTPNNGGLVVPGTANPFLAGLPDGTTASGGDDSAPAQSPVLVPGLTLNPNRPLNFAVSGSVSTDDAVPPTTGPDGGAYFFAHDAENGFPKIIAPINSLVGVFLSDAAPDPTSVNTTVRDFSDTAGGGVDYLGYQPRLAEAFFIGDGQRSNGAVQNVYPPAGATRLFLGVLDGNDYFNNLGQFNVAVTQSPLDASDVRLGQNVSSPTSTTGSSALIGDQITYTFHVKNVGSRTLTNVVVRDVLPGVLEPVSISDDGTFQGGVVTWKLGSLAPTGASTSKDLTLVVRTFAAGDSGQNVAAAQINQVVNNLNYSFTGDGLPPAVPGLDLNNTTILQAPIDVAITSNGSAVTPGGTLTYTITLKNNAPTTAKKPMVTLSLPDGVKFDVASYVDKKGNAVTLTTTDHVHFTSTAGSFELNGGQLAIFTAGNLKPGESEQLVLTVQVPYDVLPTASIDFGSAKLVTKTSDGNGQNSYGVAVPETKLSGTDPSAVPALTLLKFIPDAVSISQAIALESITEPAVALGLQALFPDVNFAKSLDKIQKQINPNIVDGTDANGFYEQQVLAAGLPNSPKDDFITYVLVYTNVGGAKVKKVTLQDRVPTGTQFVPGSATLNGVALDAGKFSLSDDGTMLFTLGNIAGDKPGKPAFGIVTYAVRVLPQSEGGPSVDAFITSSGGALDTPNLFHTTLAFPGELKTRVTAPANLFLETKQLNPTPKAGDTIAYEAYYKNTGSVTISDATLYVYLPFGATDAQTVFVTGNSGSVDSAVGTQFAINLPELKKKAEGRVRVTAKLTPLSFDSRGALVKGRMELFSAQLGAARAQAAGGPGAPQTRGRHTRGDGVLLPLDQYYLITPYSSPNVNKLFVTVTQPLAVAEGKTFDCLIAISNPTDILSTNVGAYLALPTGVDFVSADQDNAARMTDAHSVNNVYLPPTKKNGFAFSVPPHGSLLKRVTLRASVGTGGKSLVGLGARSTIANFNTNESGVAGTATLAPVYSGATEIYSIPASQSFDSLRSQIVSAAFATKGVRVPEIEGLPNFKQQLAALTPDALGIATCGDGVAFTNNTLIIPLLNNSALVAGSAKGLAVDASLANTGSSLISQDGSGLVAAGAGNLIKVTNLIAAGAGNAIGSEGRAVSVILDNLVAAGAGNLVAAGAGNLIAAGAGNLISQDGSGLVAAGAGNLIGKPGYLINNATGVVSNVLASSLLSSHGLALAGGQSNLVAAGAGNLVAAGAGNLVAAGAGNLVAAGAGNLVAAGAGNLVAAGAGNVQTSTPASSAIQFSGSGMISANNGGLISQDGSGLISQDGSGLISQDGSGLFGGNN